MKRAVVVLFLLIANAFVGGKKIERAAAIARPELKVARAVPAPPILPGQIESCFLL